MHRLAGTRDGGGSDSEDDALPELHRAPRSPNRNHPEEEETHRTCVCVAEGNEGWLQVYLGVGQKRYPLRLRYRWFMHFFGGHHCSLGRDR